MSNSYYKYKIGDMVRFKEITEGWGSLQTSLTVGKVYKILRLNNDGKYRFVYVLSDKNMEIGFSEERITMSFKDICERVLNDSAF